MIFYWIVFFWAITQFILLIGKLTGIIKWSWETVYLPISLAFVSVVFLALLTGVLIIIGQISFWLLIILI